MNRKLLSLIFLLTTLFSVQAHALQMEEMRIKVIDVQFMNDAPQSPSNPKIVLSRLKSHVGDLFSQSAFDSDLKMLATGYDHVEPNVDVVNDQIQITLKIWMKPKIRSIQFRGNKSVKGSTLKGELEVTTGTPFDRLEFNRAFQKVKAYYIKQGYFEAELDYEVQYAPGGNAVDIVICVNEGRCGKIRSIKICGVNKCEECEILKDMCTKEYNIFMSWYTNEGTYNEDMIQFDQYKILNYLQNLGYADAEVRIDIVEASACNRIDVQINIDKGCRYRISEINIKGNCLYSEEELRRRMCIREGGPYSPEALHKSVGALNDFYGRCGYIDTIIDFEPNLIDGTNCYTIDLTIEEGDQYRVGLIKVFGNCTTHSRIIMHEILVIPGEVFNLEKLKKSEEKLLNVGYFECVNVYPAQSSDLAKGDECCPYRDVHVEVKECSTGNFSAFFGYSTAEKLFGGITITEKNFNYHGLGSFWKDGLGCLRGAGEYLHFTINIGQKSSSYSVSWTEPFFCDSPWTVGFDLEHSNNRLISNEYEIEANGVGLHASYPLNAFLRFAWHHRFRHTEVLLDNDAAQNRSLREEAQNDGIVSASGLSLIYDSTNNPVCPTNGFRSRLEFELGAAKGHRFFTGLAYINTFYYELCEGRVFKFRADHRFVIPWDHGNYSNIPLDERIFLGGDNGVRGYRPYAIGPKFPDTNDPRGGLSMMLYSAEINQKIFEKMDGFLFFDAGYLSPSKFSFNTPFTALGFGVRLKVLGPCAPPVIMGFGFPLNPKSRSDVKRFFWALGGRF